jgi:hypothetical protein
MSCGALWAAIEIGQSNAMRLSQPQRAMTAKHLCAAEATDEAQVEVPLWPLDAGRTVRQDGGCFREAVHRELCGSFQVFSAAAVIVAVDGMRTS